MPRAPQGVEEFRVRVLPQACKRLGARRPLLTRGHRCPAPQDYFHNRIAQLTYTFPEDATTSTGAPFWSAPKRFPRPLNFDPSDKAHAAFVQVGGRARAGTAPVGDGLRPGRCVLACPSVLGVGQPGNAPSQPQRGIKIYRCCKLNILVYGEIPLLLQAGAILRAEVYGIPRPDWAADPAKVAAAAAKVDVPAFAPKAGVQIETDPKADRTKPAAAPERSKRMHMMAKGCCWVANVPASCAAAPMLNGSATYTEVRTSSPRPRVRSARRRGGH